MTRGGFRRQEQKRAKQSGARPLTRWFFDQDSFEDRLRGPTHRIHLTGGETSDSRNFETFLDIGPDINPRAAIGDKGYDSKSNREAARHRGEANRDKQRQNRAIIDAEVRRSGRVINTD